MREQHHASRPLDTSGEQGLAPEVIEAAIKLFENGIVEDVSG